MARSVACEPRDAGSVGRVVAILGGARCAGGSSRTTVGRPARSVAACARCVRSGAAAPPVPVRRRALAGCRPAGVRLDDHGSGRVRRVLFGLCEGGSSRAPLGRRCRMMDLGLDGKVASSPAARGHRVRLAAGLAAEGAASPSRAGSRTGGRGPAEIAARDVLDSADSSCCRCDRRGRVAVGTIDIYIAKHGRHAGPRTSRASAANGRSRTDASAIHDGVWSGCSRHASRGGSVVAISRVGAASHRRAPAVPRAPARARRGVQDPRQAGGRRRA